MKEFSISRRDLLLAGGAALLAGCSSNPDKPTPTPTRTRISEAEKFRLGRRELAQYESEAWSSLLGEPVTVPLPPKGLEKLSLVKQDLMQVHYIPKFSFVENGEYPQWKEKPGYGFLENTKAAEGYTGHVKNTLSSAWVLLDNTGLSSSARPEYEHDPFAPIIRNARKRGDVSGSFNRESDTRFHLTHQDVTEVILPRIANVFDLPEGAQVRLPTALEYNALLNKQGGTPKAWEGHNGPSEWFQESTHLGGEYPKDFGFYGDISTVDKSHSAHATVGFRPMLVFRPNS